MRDGRIEDSNRTIDITPVDARLESTEAQSAKDGVRYEKYPQQVPEAHAVCGGI